MKTTNFTGEYFERGVTRKIVTKDPATGRDISKLARYDMVTNLVIDRVSGVGVAERTGERQITLSGQYKPFGTLRITASSQNYDKVVELLKGNVNSDETRTLKNEIVVQVVGTPMKGYGMNIAELYVKQEDGSFKAVIGSSEGAASEGKSDIDQAFL